MFSDDYLIRMINQATAVLAKIMGLKNSGQYQEAIKDIDQVLGLLFGMDADFIRLLDEESLYLLLMKNEELDLEKLALIAGLFKEEGEIQELQNHINESNNCFTRSLNYYLMISNYPEFSCATEISQKIDELLQKLNPDNFEEKTLWNLFCYYENAGEFAKADDMLSKLATKKDSRVNIIDEMICFYKRLLEKSPTELAICEMNRTQIREKLRKLE